MQRPTPVSDPRTAPRPEAPNPALMRAGRQAALVLAGVGLFWVVTSWAGETWDWPTRARALVDLFALAGFGWALYLTWQVWRIRRADKR